MNEVVYKSFMVLYIIQCISAQLSSVEERRNETHCDTGNVNIDCGSSVIAVDSILYGYDATCDSICCNFNTDHCLLTMSDKSDVRRKCSGTSSCTLNLGGIQAFCSKGPHEPSYVTIYYYCIPSERKLSVCSSDTIQSSSSPLYLTNKGYPGVTTGVSTCSCSLEIHDCSSSVYLYIIDADLYLDTSSCEQRLEIRDNLNVTLQEIKCESYYGSDITTHTLNKHYITINFWDNSKANQEGLFFLGFAASAVNTQFSLSCSSVPEIRCVDCAPITSIDIGNGNASLIVENDSSNGARANVVCEDGYNATKPTIECLDTGLWETSTCIADGNGDSKEDLDTDTDEGKEGGQDFAAWKIAVIVLSVAVVIALLAVLIVVKWCTNSNRDQDTKSDREDLAYEQYAATVPPVPPRGTEMTSYLTSGVPLPAITPQHKIKHGPVYIDHNDAHIFGLTIHIPFRKENKLAPIDRHEY